MYNREMAKTTLSKQSREYETVDGTKETDQFKTTVPKALVDAMDWDEGEQLEWSVEAGNKLSIEGDGR